MASTVIGPKELQDETPDHIESTLTEYIPRRTRNMTVDAVNWAEDIKAVREHNLFTYAGCETFDEYREKHLKVSAEWIEKVIAGAIIIERDDLSDRSMQNAIAVHEQSTKVEADPEGKGGNPTGANQHTKENGGTFDNVQGSSDDKAPTGNSQAATLRRIIRTAKGHATPRTPAPTPEKQRQAQELLAGIEAGTMTANKAAMELGFRERTVSIKLNPESAAKTITKHFSNEDIEELIGRLQMAIEALSA